VVVAVVALARVWVGEDVVGFGDLVEAGCGGGGGVGGGGGGRRVRAGEVGVVELGEGVELAVRLECC
jgi:hypothetical protein